MKKNLLLSCLAVAGAFGIASADINVTVPKDYPGNSISYFYAPIKQFVEAKTRAERGVVTDSVAISNSKAVISIPSEADSYLFSLNIDNNNVNVYASKGDNINLDVTSCNPFSYTMGGTDLADGINELNLQIDPIMAKAMELRSTGNPNPEEMNALGNQYIETNKNFIANNPTNPAVGVAILNLEGEDFISAYESLPASFSNTLLYPMVAKQYESEKKALEMANKQKALQAGNVMAPDFTLKNLEGKDVSLSDFRGKWVIIDFWGTWCPWCIKGFPELKEAYEKYNGELEIVGVDCRDTEAQWKAGVEKYQLPWVNVYNPEGSSVLADYSVQGFPTKAIVSPEGLIKNITVGHNPDFFKILAELMGK